jgi:hypothetical protein
MRTRAGGIALHGAPACLKRAVSVAALQPHSTEQPPGRTVGRIVHDAIDKTGFYASSSRLSPGKWRRCGEREQYRGGDNRATPNRCCHLRPDEEKEIEGGPLGIALCDKGQVRVPRRRIAVDVQRRCS